MAEVKTSPRKVVLVCLDGMGIDEPGPGNAVLNAPTPCFDKLRESAMYARIKASGLPVGLPDGTMGNSEVGHLTIGAGRRETQDIVKIDEAVADGSFATIPSLVEAFDTAKAGTGRVHLVGLLSTGGIHSHINHVKAFLDAAKAAAVPKTFLHAVTDGRDTAPTSGVGFVQDILDKMQAIEYGSLATVTGRFYLMDRDKRWERVQTAYEGIVEGKGEDSSDVIASMQKSYTDDPQKGTDEFLKPIICNKDGLIQAGDTVIFFNYRADRMREIVEVMGYGPAGKSADGSDWPPFELSAPMPQVNVVMMTLYKKGYDFPVLFQKESLENGLSEWVSKQGLLQFHCAETEKYAHVTFFFNGGKEVQFPGEDRALSPSPSVPTYDETPHMNNAAVADNMVAAVKKGTYSFLVCNFAAPDMIGHTGVYEKALIGVQSTDTAVGRVLAACEEEGCVFMMTSDHGNCETMLAADGGPHTQHTTNDVDFFCAGDVGPLRMVTGEGDLCMIAPTVLAAMGVDQPPEMTAKSMLG